MKLIVFSGTSEGHNLCRFLSGRGQTADIFVATDYGEAVMEPLAGITVHRGRLTVQQMAEQMAAGALVIDATHPYASEVTKNIKAACAESARSSLTRRIPMPAKSRKILRRPARRAAQSICVCCVRVPRQRALSPCRIPPKRSRGSKNMKERFC